MEESFRNPDLFGKQVSRRMLKYKGLSALEATEQLKSGGNINLRYVLHGPYMYVLPAEPELLMLFLPVLF
jgi:hypothetical protein